MLVDASHDGIRHTGDFHLVAGRFQDIVEGAGFLRVCDDAGETPLRNLIGLVLPHLVRGVPMPELRYLRVRGTDFVHGGALFGQGMLVGFYFEQANVGLLNYAKFSGECTFARLTSVGKEEGLTLGTRQLGIA